MFRYVALIWSSADQRQSEAAQLVERRLRALSSQWREVLSHRGVRVFCADVRSGSLEPHVLKDNAGVVLGTLFELNANPADEAPARKAVLDTKQVADIVSSHGRRLVTKYWGNYVAVLLDPLTERTWVIKDPTGTLPCFTTAFRGLSIFFSCIADCLDLRLQQFTLNRSYLRDLMSGSSWRPEQNAVHEISRVYGGECVETRVDGQMREVSRDLYWSPLSFSESVDAIENPDQATRALRGTVRACTQAWAGGHESLLHRLSGGLDSSIVVGCLRDAPAKPRMACYTHYHPQGRSDERPWARLAAQHVGCEHVECAIDPADIPLAAALRRPPSVEPVPALGYLQRTTLERKLAAERGATAVFSGDGGDSGFGSEAISHVVADYLRRHGLRPEVFRLASQVALCTGLSGWAVLARSLRGWLTGSGTSAPRKELVESCRLVSADILALLHEQTQYVHPWFRSARGVPWATVRRLGALPGVADFYGGSSDVEAFAPEVISPLYSQPAIELFLRIPLYVHFEGGRDRGLARRAFAREVPQPILARLWKDRAPGFHAELVRCNLEFLRELFLDGVLMKEGLLDRAAVESALSTTPSKSAVRPTEILKHLDVEIWARRWK